MKLGRSLALPTYRSDNAGLSSAPPRVTRAVLSPGNTAILIFFGLSLTLQTLHPRRLRPCPGSVPGLQTIRVTGFVRTVGQPEVLRQAFKEESIDFIRNKDFCSNSTGKSMENPRAKTKETLFRIKSYVRVK